MIGAPLSKRFADRQALRGKRYGSEAELTEAMLASPGAYHIIIEHDQGRGCTRLACRCSPTFLVRELTVEAALEGEECERQWIRENGS